MRSSATGDSVKISCIGSNCLLRHPLFAARCGHFPCLLNTYRSLRKKSWQEVPNDRQESLNVFQGYGWPGNIRELQNVIERAVILSEGETFAVDETWLRRELPASPTRRDRLNGTLANQEKEMIEAALAASEGRISGPSGAVTKLGLPSHTSILN
jgi:DNA-binding NtrC family response regulator